MGEFARTAAVFRRWWPVVLAGLLLAAVAGFVALLWIIQAGAHGYAQVAQKHYPGSEFEALVRAVEDEHAALRDRNHAVWALGQFRDARALPTLRRYYTGAKCQHDKFLCQSELEKAIDLCSGRTTAPRWFREVTGWAVPKWRSGA